jgi:hypothetical protein
MSNNRLNQPNICVVCLDETTPSSGTVTTPCCHTYCTSCFVQHMRLDNRCAICRTEVGPPLKKKQEVLNSDRRNDMASLVVEDFITAGGISSLHADISNQVRIRLQQNNNVSTRAASTAVDQTLSAMTSVRLDFDLWWIVIQAVNMASDWYEGEGVDQALEGDLSQGVDDADMERYILQPIEGDLSQGIDQPIHPLDAELMDWNDPIFHLL